MVNGLALRPRRVCEWMAGPEEDSLMRIMAKRMSGAVKISSTIARRNSSANLAKAYHEGVEEPGGATWGCGAPRFSRGNKSVRTNIDLPLPVCSVRLVRR